MRFVKLRKIEIESIISTVERLCMDANYCLGDDVYTAINQAVGKETELGAEVLTTILKNADLAKENRVAMCQDTGMVVVFIDVGQQVEIVGGLLTDAINEGVRRGYEKGFLRNSIVKDPVDRINTNDNTPSVIHYNIVDGDNLEITVVPKGFGSENMGSIKMLNPSDGINGIMDFITEVVRKGGSNACPPLVIGVGIGGTMEKAAILAKRAILRPVGSSNENEFWNTIENDLLKRINALDIGPAGLGGVTTALCVNIETYPTHIAGLPVAVNINCHAARHARVIL